MLELLWDAIFNTVPVVVNVLLKLDCDSCF